MTSRAGHQVGAPRFPVYSATCGPLKMRAKTAFAARPPISLCICPFNVKCRPLDRLRSRQESMAVSTMCEDIAGSAIRAYVAVSS